MVHKKSQTGRIGEEAAAKFLAGRGFNVLEMNYKNDTGHQVGEIDIIAEDRNQNEIVFVEVKTRDYSKYKNTLPEENINFRKLHKLAKIAQIYLKQKNLSERAYRFDAVSVWLDYDSRMAKIRHIPNIYL